jgi:hypothetical protein
MRMDWINEMENVNFKKTAAEIEGGINFAEWILKFKTTFRKYFYIQGQMVIKSGISHDPLAFYDYFSNGN